MKKLVTAACALVAGIVMAEGVGSQNVVGYTTVTCAAGKWYMLGAQFEDTSSTASTRIALTLQDLIQGCVGVEFGDGSTFATTAASVQIWNPTLNNGNGGYNIRYYLSDGWFDNGTEEGDFAPGWCDDGGNLVDDEIPIGKAMWFKSPSGDTVKLLGAVLGGRSSFSCASGKWEMPLVALPKVTSLSDPLLTWSGVANVEFGDGSTFATTAASVQIWDPTLNNGNGGYNIRYYLSDGWFDDGTEEGDFAPGWCDDGGNLVEDTIPVGCGFWFKPTTAVTILCDSPIAN